jgi:hypothetical protein
MRQAAEFAVQASKKRGNATFGRAKKNGRRTGRPIHFRRGAPEKDVNQNL